MKILVVRVGRLGDLVMLTPALTFLNRHCPEAEFHLLSGIEAKPLLPFLPIKFHRLLVYDRRHIFGGQERRKLQEILATENYDRILCLETNPKPYLSLFGSNGTDLFVSPPGNGRHMAETNLDAVQKALNSNVPAGADNYPLKLCITEELSRQTRTYFAQHGISDDTFVVGLHPSFSGIHKPHKILKRFAHKKWRNDRYASVACQIRRMLDGQNIKNRVLMNLLPGEQRRATAIEKLSQGMAENFALEPGFKNYLGYLHRIDLLITPDTGPMHLAAALETNVMALFSGEHPDKCGPWCRRAGVVTIRAEELPGNTSGINRITADYAASVFQQNLPHFLANRFSVRLPGILLT